ncbi:putative F-box domain-containing protein [Tanacetum coccineum]
MVMSDIVEAILLRCLVKDLLRCKSVCKSWYSLISSPSFAKTHAKFICNKEEDNNKKIDMIRSYFERSGCHYSVRRGARIFVTNPVTREFRELQQPPEWSGAGETQCFGFGYDLSTDDYKVVMAICQKGPEKRETEEVYSVEDKEEENKSSLVEVGNIFESEES